MARFTYPYEITKLYAIKEKEPDKVDTEISYAFAVQENFDIIKKYLNEMIDADNIIQNTTKSPLFIGGSDNSGWISSGETWTYASANTFTISGDRTVMYQVGDKIKLTQNSSVKYFLITGASYSSPDTTITVMGGDDYSLINDIIINSYYSKIENPQNFPYWFNWTPTYSASTGMTFTSVNTEIAKYCTIGKILFFLISFNGTTGGAGKSYIKFTLPVTCADVAIGSIGNGCLIKDGTDLSGMWYKGSGNTILIGRYDQANWSLGANIGANLQGFYRIA